MLPNGGVGLTRANGFGPLPELFGARAGDRALERAFEQQGLPLGLVETPQMPIPYPAMIGILDCCARVLGDRTFGLDIGEGMTEGSYGFWGRYVMAAPTLGEALRRLCSTSWAHQVGARQEVIRERGRWVWRNIVRHVDPDIRQHSDHILPPFIALCRMYLGRDWMPEWVEVNYPRDADAARLEARLKVPVFYGRRGTGVPLREGDLHRTRLYSPLPDATVTLREVVADVLLTDAPEPARSLSAVVTLRLLDGHIDLDGAARAAGLSVQGLQRRLRSSRYTYRELVDRARQARALALLRETDLRGIDVATALGYEEHANFSRAFKRWTGMAPSHFRLISRSRRPVVAALPPGHGAP